MHEAAGVVAALAPLVGIAQVAAAVAAPVMVALWGVADRVFEAAAVPAVALVSLESVANAPSALRLYEAGLLAVHEAAPRPAVTLPPLEPIAHLNLSVSSLRRVGGIVGVEGEAC